ncbi:MAG: YbjQ family protein [Bacteroidia bacterium]
MLITTTQDIPGREIAEILDIARGSTVRSRNIGRDFGAAMRSIVGGEVKAYTTLMAKAREEALDRMIADGRALGADAIVNVRLQTSSVMTGASEIVAYGTAVKLK